MKVDLLNLESQNQAKNVLLGLPSSRTKTWVMIGHTNRDYNFLYIKMYKNV